MRSAARTLYASRKAWGIAHDRDALGSSGEDGGSSCAKEAFTGGWLE